MSQVHLIWAMKELKREGNDWVDLQTIKHKMVKDYNYNPDRLRNVIYDDLDKLVRFRVIKVKANGSFHKNRLFKI